MPEKGVIRRQTGRPDVFKVTQTFRNNGKPDNKRKCIGQYDAESGMLIPNNAYYEFYAQPEGKLAAKYKVSQLPDEHSIANPGAVWFVNEIFDTLRITGILDNVFGEAVATRIILTATYMVRRGNVMEYSADWCEQHVLGDEFISSQSTSRLFAGIDFMKQMAFFRQWITLRAQSEYFAYDVTSFSSYAKGIENLEWGYNRDKERLPQINMALYVGQTSQLPVFYLTYQGSIVDKSHLRYMMAFNDELGITGVSFVLDCAFCNTVNLEYMREKDYVYIVAVEIRHKATRAAIEEIKADINSLEYYISENTRGKSVKGIFYGVDATMHVYYDRSRHERDDNTLIHTVENAESELKQRILGQTKLGSKEIKKYTKYFDLELNGDIPTGFKRNFDKLNALAKIHGFFCLLSNSDLGAGEVLSIYRNKDSIEKAFDEVKNYVDMKRLHTHNTDTTKGKLFCAFIALIAAMHMQNKLAVLMDKKNLTKENIILELDKITAVQFGETSRQYAPLSKLQKDILKEFSLTEDTFAKFLAE
jgi:transposase